MRRRSATIGAVIIGALVATGAVAPAAVAAPPQDRVAFVSLNSAKSKIVTMRSDGKKKRTVKNEASVTFPGNFASAQLSPDGKRLVYVHLKPGPNGVAVWVSKANGKGAKRILTSTSSKYFHSPSWSPDGERIVYVEDGPKTRIKTIQANGKKAKVVRTFAKSVLAPSFSPDGTGIVFSREVSGSLLRVATMTVDGKKLRTLKGKVGHNIASGFSPDGQRIAFVRLPLVPLRAASAALTRGGDIASLISSMPRGGAGERGDVFTMKTTGKGVKRVTKDARALGSARYSADGDRILVSKLTPAETSIELFSVKATGQTGIGKRLTNTLETFNIFDLLTIFGAS